MRAAPYCEVMPYILAYTYAHQMRGPLTMLLMLAAASSDALNALLHGIDRVRAASRGFAGKVYADRHPSPAQKTQAHFCFGLVGQEKTQTNLERIFLAKRGVVLQ